MLVIVPVLGIGGEVVTLAAPAFDHQTSREACDRVPVSAALFVVSFDENP